MNRDTQVECPMCGRVVKFVKDVADLAGEPIMARHWRADVMRWEWCKASNCSVRVATVKRSHYNWLGGTEVTRG